MEVELSCRFLDGEYTLNRGRLIYRKPVPDANGEKEFVMELINACPEYREYRYCAWRKNLLYLLSIPLAPTATVTFFRYCQSSGKPEWLVFVAMILMGLGVILPIYFSQFIRRGYRKLEIVFFRGKYGGISIQVPLRPNPAQVAFLERLNEEIAKRTTFDKNFARTHSVVLPRCFLSLKKLADQNIISQEKFTELKQRRFREAGMVIRSLSPLPGNQEPAGHSIPSSESRAGAASDN